MTPMQALEASAQTVDGWLVIYGIEARWRAGPNGMTLGARGNGHEFRRTISWMEINRARNPRDVFARVEAKALQGLSD